MKLLIDTLILALIDANQDVAHKLEWRSCGDTCCKPLEEKANKIFNDCSSVRSALVQSHLNCSLEGCTLCANEWGIGTNIDYSTTEPQVGTYAYTARMMAEIMPEYDWDAWKDEMKERDL